MTTCGIDFGTTNSTIGVCHHKKTLMIKAEGENVSIPTALFFKEKSDIPLFGRAAIYQYVNGADGRFIRSIKRILGTDLMDKFTAINGKGFRFDEMIRLFLLHLKAKAESAIDEEITSAVIGRPVHFQDNDTKADEKAEAKLKEIAQKVGFKNIAFQYEPLAAAFSHEQVLTQEKLALVIDLGGGTSDFTIIRLGPKHINKTDRKDDILSTAGVRVGGNDFDKALSLNAFMPAFGKGSVYGTKHLNCPAYLFSDLSEWSKINFTYTEKNKQLIQSILCQSEDALKVERLLNLIEYQEAHRLLNVVENTKIALTNQEQITSCFEAFKENITFHALKSEFENSIKYDISKIEKAMNECLSIANLTADKINLVILTGGSCEIPKVQETFKKLFPCAEFSEKEKLLSVGAGLAFKSGQTF